MTGYARLWLGGVAGGCLGDHVMTGLIGDFRLYDRALSASEISLISGQTGCAPGQTDTFAGWKKKTRSDSVPWPYDSSATAGFCRKGILYSNDIGGCHWVSDGAPNDPVDPCIKGYSYNANYVYGDECSSTPHGKSTTYCCCLERASAGMGIYSGLLMDNKLRHGGAWTNVLETCPMLHDTFCDNGTPEGRCKGHTNLYMAG